MNNQNEVEEKKEEALFEYKKENYDIDTSENNLNINQINKDITKKENKTKNEKNEEFIFPKIKEDEENRINRISNLKDNELPLEDKIQIENQVDNDNDNESEQIEVLENILNNFGKEKYQNKFIEYKNIKRNNFKSQSISFNNTKNNLLNKIKHDIAIINFEQTLNKICNSNHNFMIKKEKINANIINNIKINKNKSINNNIVRIEELRKKLLSGINNSKAKSITNHKRNLNKLFFNNKNEKEDNFYSSCNSNFFNYTNKQRLYNSLFNDINNIKEIKINNFNVNHIYNNFYDTFRNKRINIENGTKKVLPINTKRKNINNDMKADESPEISLSNHNTNQFFYNVFQNSIKKYPYLYLLKSKVNKMKNDDFSQHNNSKNIKKKIINNDEKEVESEPKISLLEKIKLQKDIFQKEIDKYKKK
jgi:hypothetical protein